MKVNFSDLYTVTIGILSSGIRTSSPEVLRENPKHFDM